MGERDKLRRGLLGLLLAVVTSSILWGVAIAAVLLLGRTQWGAQHIGTSAIFSRDWWTSGGVRSGLALLLLTIFMIVLAAEARRLLLNRRRLRAELEADAWTPWPEAETPPPAAPSRFELSGQSESHQRD